MEPGNSRDGYKDDGETVSMSPYSQDNVADSVSISVFEFLKAFAEQWHPSADAKSPSKQIVLSRHLGQVGDAQGVGDDPCPGEQGLFSTSRHWEFRGFIAQDHFKPARLLYIIVDLRMQAQHRTLFVHAVTCLSTAVKYMATDFVDFGGLSLLIRLIEWRTFPKLMKDFLNMMLYVCVASSVSQKACTLLLRRNKSRQDEKGTVDTLVDWLREFGSREAASRLVELSETAEAFSLHSQHCAVLLIATLGATDVDARAQLRKSQGLRLLIDEFHATFTMIDCLQGSASISYLICLVECIWVTVVGDPENEEVFLQNGGLDVLLETLQVVPKTLQRHLLGCLTELLRNRLAVETCREWRSRKTRKSAMQLLLDKWLHEQQRFHSVTACGAIQDIMRPLNPRALPPPNSQGSIGSNGVQADRVKPPEKLSGVPSKQRVLGHLPSGSSDAWGTSSALSPTSGGLMQTPASSVVTNSTRESLRVAPLGLRGVRQSVELQENDEQPPVDVRLDLYSMAAALSDEFRVIEDGLTVSDRQQIEVMRRYPEFRLLEAWGDVRTKLEEKVICPVESDKSWMEMSIEKLVATSLDTQERQKALFQQGRPSNSVTYFDDIQVGDILLKNGAAAGTDPQNKTRFSLTSIQ
ncbi:conserved hypothetical protein [Neospora caninum Liverpool]|uniref:Cilia- and flagella-associated protein 69 ARM repeats domain-containing protein n=1 Tax=Neospora caninum (strain Liverpool) TaxID=572307 RepID=F0VP19_NEOCL|nr:conserved hypothetical protein [Neospora caninum Liverpool]CBZ55465.1 conserved hypothetical protein [Neospora caninum Liverpool]|eukprot:XP_003885493.1 conserved hypothetical protein [Neospora caninum Liverpool]